MFEPWMKMCDVVGGMMAGAFSSSVEAASSLMQHTAGTAAAMMHESAKGGDSVAGPWGAVVGGSMGLMLGSVMGVCSGTGVLAGIVPADAGSADDESDDESTDDATPGAPRAPRKTSSTHSTPARKK